MAPDFEYVVRLEPWARVGHWWPGVLTVTLPAALVVIVWWQWVGRLAIRDLFALAPLGRSDTHVSTGASWWGKALLAATLGTASHIVWDGFTHWDGFAAEWFPALAQPVTAAYPRFFWANVLQHGSTLAGAIVIMIWYVRERRVAGLPTAFTDRWRIRALGAVLVVALLVAWLNAPRHGTMTDPSVLKLMAGRFVVGAMAGLAVGAVAYAAWWRATPRGTKIANSVTR